ncbi:MULTISPECIES: MFS transporter [Prauserella salsuginis group]|uniref:MFS family permease n=2 Tax=Prauserella salsuginis group TaxID=2893672 RepID=A0A839XUB8_9PSEU|nr:MULTISPECIES: MFS transporter [Prauserella salsuginis group]MBB3663606.1 MFS family permease [Prauserella sediminis]MCR3722612.1 putative arabinose efflux permease, MFS family [Prauserella flava]MCR3737054.1 putative arabinose efflux permease, MFS family [Prauserella salsuginis]
MTEQRQTFAVLWLGQFAATAGLTVVVPLLPFYLAQLGTPPGDIALWTGVSLAAPAVTQMITGPLWGAVGDRYGRKAMVVRAHAGLAISLVLMALATTPGAFLAFRLLQGACGGVVSATATYASTLAAEDRRGRVLGGLFGATAAGALLGPLAGGVLAGTWGFGPIFVTVAGLLACSSVAAAWLLTEPERLPASGERAPLRAAAGVLLRRPDTRNVLLAGLAGQAAIYALVVVFAPQIHRITGSIADAAMWVGVLQATTWAASWAGGPWWGRYNDRALAQRGFAIAAACCAIAATLQAVVTSVELLIPLRMVQGFCFAAFLQSVLHVTSARVRERLSGTAFGFSTGVLDFGQVVGPLFGAVIAVTLPPVGAFGAIGVLLGIAALLAVRSAGRHSHAPITVAPEPRSAHV